MSVNDARGPSVDNIAASKGKKAGRGEEGLSHRASNTRKEAVKSIVSWSPDLFVVDPAPAATTPSGLAPGSLTGCAGRPASRPASVEPVGGQLLLVLTV